jgi:hypothetical protein
MSQNGAAASAMPPSQQPLQQFQRMNWGKADKPGIVFKLFLLLPMEDCASFQYLGSPGFATDIKTRDHGSARSTPFIDNSPKPLLTMSSSAHPVQSGFRWIGLQSCPTLLTPHRKPYEGYADSTTPKLQTLERSG